MLGEGCSVAEQLCHAWLMATAVDGGPTLLLFDKKCLKQRDRVDNLFTVGFRPVGCVYVVRRLENREESAARCRPGIVNEISADCAFRAGRACFRPSCWVPAKFTDPSVHEPSRDRQTGGIRGVLGCLPSAIRDIPAGRTACGRSGTTRPERCRLSASCRTSGILCGVAHGSLSRDPLPARTV